MPSERENPGPYDEKAVTYTTFPNRLHDNASSACGNRPIYKMERLHGLLDTFNCHSSPSCSHPQVFLYGLWQDVSVSRIVCPLPFGMGAVLCISPTLAGGFLDLLRLRPAPTTDIDSTRCAAILCP